MKAVKIFIFLVLFQFIFIMTLHAGTIEGTVLCKDKNGAPAKITKIKVVGKQSAQTNNNGYYRLNLRPGQYVFKIKGKYFDVSIYPYDTPKDFYINCN